jgi:hypothetical protein
MRKGISWGYARKSGLGLGYKTSMVVLRVSLFSSDKCFPGVGSLQGL